MGLKVRSLLSIGFFNLFIFLSESCSDKLSFSIFSGNDTTVVGPDMPWGGKAIPTYSGYPGWGTISSSIPGAVWMWDSYYVSNPVIDQTCYFSQDFVIPGPPLYGLLTICVDNLDTTFINGVNINCSGNFPIVQKCNITSYLISGLNTINVIATNRGNGAGAASTNNPAGLIFGIDIRYNNINY
jgi:hypothetical protein